MLPNYDDFHKILSASHGIVSDESPRLKHDGPGLLSMSVADRDTVGSQFIVTFSANHHLDRFVYLLDCYSIWFSSMDVCQIVLNLVLFVWYMKKFSSA